MFADDGSEMPESIRDTTGRDMLDYGLNFEPHVWAEIERIKPKRFLDIGCNVGLYTLAVKDLVSESEIVAIDASKQNCQILMRSLIENQVQGVTVLNVPLADERRIIQVMHSNQVNPICRTEISDEPKHWELAQALPLSAFDFKMPFDLIKIDVDGFEYLVVRGIVGRLLCCPIIFELCPQLTLRSGVTPKELINWFFHNGFRLTVLDWQHCEPLKLERKIWICDNFRDVMDALGQGNGWLTDILAEPI